tara:strand:- start:155 stop:376 length:222 start_codon:yes stop_codon:yes gene_type:complete
MSEKKQIGFRVNFSGTHHVLVMADSDEEAIQKLHKFYEKNSEALGVGGYEINKGPTDRYEDSKDVRIIIPKEY